MVLIPGSGRYPGEGNVNPLWNSSLENSVDWGDCAQKVGHDWLINTFIFTSQPLWRMIQKFLKKAKIELPLAKWVKVTQSCLTLCNTMDYTVHGILQARILEWGFLFQGIFPIQGLDSGLLHCRWILYQLSYQGSSYITIYYVVKSMRRGAAKPWWPDIIYLALWSEIWPHDLAIRLLGKHKEEDIIQKDTCTLIFTGALFATAKRW